MIPTRSPPKPEKDVKADHQVDSNLRRKNKKKG
jgi:hypothetical protein